MKRNISKLLAATLFLAGSGQAFSAELGTDANTTVSNTVSIAWKVGGIQQTAPADPTQTVEFLVDRKVNVTATGDSVGSIAPGTTQVMLTFQVTNKTNDTGDFLLTAVPGGDFTLSNVKMYVDTSDTTFTAGTDDVTEGDYIDDLGEDVTRNVYVFADIPLTATDAQAATITLTAQAYDKAGTVAAHPIGNVLTETAAADVKTVVENVFADGDSDGAGTADEDQDGRFGAVGTYTVSATSIAVNKEYKVIWDGFSAAGEEKAVPGAVILYCITIHNQGATAADHIDVSDQISDVAKTTYLPDTVVALTNGGPGGIRVASSASAPTCSAAAFLAATAVDDDATDETDDENVDVVASGIVGQYDAGTHTISSSVKQLSGSSYTTTMFKVTIN